MTKVLAGKNPNDFFAYFKDTEQLIGTPSGAMTVQDFLDPAHIQRALATRSAFYAKKVVLML